MNSALAFLWQITNPTPIKYAWAALTFVNVAMMLWLAIRRGPVGFRAYMAVAAVAGVIQNSRHWGISGEVVVALASAVLVAEILALATRAIHGDERRYSRITAVIFGCVWFFLLLAIDPEPWPNFPAVLYYARIYSVTLCCATCTGCAVWMASQRKPMPRGTLAHAVIAAVWFFAILWVPIGIRQLGLDVWWVRIEANLGQIACEVPWIWISAVPDGASVLRFPERA